MTKVVDVNDYTRSNAKSSPRKILFGVLALVTVMAVAAIDTKAFGGASGDFRIWQSRSVMHDSIDPAHAERRIKRMVRHIAIEIDATTEQQDRLIGIFTLAARDLLPVRDKVLAARRSARGLLTQPSIDRSALESLRAEQITRAEFVSKRITKAVADAADVLTPAQRITLSERIAQFMNFHRP